MCVISPRVATHCIRSSREHDAQDTQGTDDAQDTFWEETGHDVHVIINPCGLLLQFHLQFVQSCGARHSCQIQEQLLELQLTSSVSSCLRTFCRKGLPHEHVDSFMPDVTDLVGHWREHNRAHNISGRLPIGDVGDSHSLSRTLSVYRDFEKDER